jgi:multicomponent K+:H+ antiporter subunit G
VLELVIALALVISGVFGFVGSFGLVKLTNTVQRLHAPTKATTLGVGGVLIASMIYFYATNGRLSVHELLITLFLFLTAPITANFIAKVYMVRQLRATDLPGTGRESGWAPYDDPVDPEGVSR